MIPEYQNYQGKKYKTNEVGGIDIFTKEPIEKCPICNEECTAEFVDNGFGPYSVQVGPYHCYACGWTEGSDQSSHRTESNIGQDGVNGWWDGDGWHWYENGEGQE